MIMAGFQIYKMIIDMLVKIQIPGPHLQRFEFRSSSCPEDPPLHNHPSPFKKWGLSECMLGSSGVEGGWVEG